MRTLTMPNRLSDIWSFKRVAPAATKIDGFFAETFQKAVLFTWSVDIECTVHNVYDVDTSLRVFCRY